MRQNEIRINGCYRLKPEVLRNCVQVNGEPFKSADVTIVRQRFPEGRKTAWFYDAAGNAYRAKDFSGIADVIEVTL